MLISQAFVVVFLSNRLKSSLVRPGARVLFETAVFIAHILEAKPHWPALGACYFTLISSLLSTFLSSGGSSPCLLLRFNSILPFKHDQQLNRYLSVRRAYS